MTLGLKPQQTYASTEEALFQEQGFQAATANTIK